MISFGVDTSSYEGKPQSRLDARRVQHYNQYPGNGKPLQNGGFGIALAQVPEPSMLFPIGPRTTMKPMEGNSYEVFGATEITIAIVGATEPLSVVYENVLLKDSKQRVVLEPGQWIKARSNDGQNRSVTTSELYIYFVIKGDETRTIHYINLTGFKTKHGQAILKSVAELAAQYQKMAKKAGKDKPLPGNHLFWITLGNGEPQEVASSLDNQKKSYIIPPVIVWPDGKFPTTPAEMAKVMAMAEYEEFSTIAKQVDDFLAGPYSPSARVNRLSPQFQKLTGFTQLEDGKVAAAAQLSAPKKNSDFETAPDVSPADYLKSADNDDKPLGQLLEEYGTSIDEVVAVFEKDSITQVPQTIRDILYTLNA